MINHTIFSSYNPMEMWREKENHDLDRQEDSFLILFFPLRTSFFPFIHLPVCVLSFFTCPIFLFALEIFSVALFVVSVNFRSQVPSLVSSPPLLLFFSKTRFLPRFFIPSLFYKLFSPLYSLCYLLLNYL